MWCPQEAVCCDNTELVDLASSGWRAVSAASGGRWVSVGLGRSIKLTFRPEVRRKSGLAPSNNEPRLQRPKDSEPPTDGRELTEPADRWLARCSAHPDETVSTQSTQDLPSLRSSKSALHHPNRRSPSAVSTRATTAKPIVKRECHTHGRKKQNQHVSWECLVPSYNDHTHQELRTPTRGRTPLLLDRLIAKRPIDTQGFLWCLIEHTSQDHNGMSNLNALMMLLQRRHRVES
jgi:hypothetical protein